MTEATIKEHGLPCKAEMVRAIREDRKTQTRRIVTAQNSLLDGGSVVKRVWNLLDFSRAYPDGGPSPAGNDGPYLHVPRLPEDQWPEEDRGQYDPGVVHRVYPRVQQGDALWVREMWRPVMYAYSSGIEFNADAVVKNTTGDNFEKLQALIEHSGGCLRFPGARKEKQNERWRPSIHLPRWACREVMPVLDVRVQQVQEISGEDITAEGVHGNDHAVNYLRLMFQRLWNSINEARGHGWDVNDWVWAYTFRRQA